MYQEESKTLAGMYRGYMRNNEEKCGPGTFKWDNESVFNGEFDDDQPQGFGKIVHKDGSYYEGRWRYGQANDAKGFYRFPNGTTYEGEFEAGTMSGDGS